MKLTLFNGTELTVDLVSESVRPVGRDGVQKKVLEIVIPPDSSTTIDDLRDMFIPENTKTMVAAATNRSVTFNGYTEVVSIGNTIDENSYIRNILLAQL